MTNREFAKTLTRQQLSALLIQNTDMLLSEIAAMPTDQLCKLIELLPQEIQEGVRA